MKQVATKSRLAARLLLAGTATQAMADGVPNAIEQAHTGGSSDASFVSNNLHGQTEEEGP